MPADIMEKATASPVPATPANVSATPDKPKTASESRKSSKPIMEKRRRARINESLGQLKTLILDALKKDSSRHSKLEKADILEMTVRHLRNLQRAQMTAALSADPSVLGKYRAGFSECINEVTRFLSTCEGVNAEVRTRLLSHLANCMSQISGLSYPPAAAGHMQQLPASGASLGPCKTSAAEALAAATKLYGGFQLVPASDGQLAFLIPSAALAASGQLTPGPIIPLFANGTALPPAASPATRPPAPALAAAAAAAPGFSLALAAASPLSAGGTTDCADTVWRPW
ncbi:transcription factor HES-1 [Amblyraja radiata]|uniref:transcription factor HES-1 n=1 Tax=Amblyraja radiata TaxID=386614 RepID=UPI001404267E|nr:transcription factor HES-1 [Amblyraja radiata]